MRRAAVYCRISDDRGLHALGVARQEADGRALAERKGWTVADVYTDNDISATRKGGKRKVRPEYDRLVDDVKNGIVDAVIVWDFDRLFRDPLEQEQFFLMCEKIGNVRVATIGTEVNIDSGYGLLEARIRGAVAAEEVRKTSERARRKHLELAEAGKSSGGGTRPFGYESDRVSVRGDEAVLLREAADRLLAGESLRGICMDWTARGVPTVTGTGWKVGILKRAVTSGRVCGWREHHGELVAKADWPAILTRDTVDHLRAILNDPARRTNHLARSYLLTGGIIRCAACGAGMVSRPRDDGRRRYICGKGPGYVGCNQTFILAEPVEDFVAELLFRHVDSDTFAQSFAAASKPADDPALEIAACEQKLADLAQAWAADEMTRGEWTAARQHLTKRIDAARRRKTPARPTVKPGSGARLRSEWPAMSFDQKRALVALFVASVEIGPARRGYNRVDLSRVKVTWKV